MSQSQHIKKSLVFGALLLMIPLVLTFYAWQLTEQNLQEVKRTKFETLAKESEKALIHRMDSYNQALLGGKGFYEGSSSVDRAGWKSYVNATDVLNNFPGINGIGTIYDVSPDKLDSFVQKSHADGYPNFSIKPKGKFDHYFIINYIEPIDINEQAVGLNIAFEANRFEAAIKARDTGRSSITKRIWLVQDTEKTPGFLLLLPTYHRHMPITDVEQRRNAFKRWIYAPFIAKNFMQGLTDSQGKTLHLQVYDGDKEDRKNLIFDSNTNPQTFAKPDFTIHKKIEIMQQEWLLVWSSTSAFEQIEESHEPFLVLLSGLLFTGLFGIFLVVINIRQSKEITLSSKSYIIPVLACLVTVSTAYYLKNQIDLREEENIQRATNEVARMLKQTIETNVNSHILALGRMADRWSQRGGTPYSEWQRDAKAYVKDQPGLKVVEWVDDTYRVRWVEPIKGNEAAIGLNVMFNKQREEALKGASDSHTVTITPPLDLVQGYKGFISYSPIRVNNKFNGFIVGVFDVNDVIQSSLSEFSDGNFMLQLKNTDGTFYSNSSDEVQSHPGMVAKTIEVFDKQWALLVAPGDQYIRESRSFLSELILVLGGVLSLMIAAVINFAQRTQLKTNLLAEKENLLSTFVQHTPAAVAMFDRDFTYIAASAQWYKDYDIVGRNIIGKSHYDVFPEICEKQPQWIVRQQQAAVGEVIKVDEEQVPHKDGRVIWMRYELHPWYNAQGNTGGFVMFSEDITERKHVEEMKTEFISTVNHELRTPLTSIQGSLGLLKAMCSDSMDEKSQRLLKLSYDNCERLTHLVNDILDIEKIAAGKMKFELVPVEMTQLIDTIVEQNQSYADKYGVTYELVCGLRQVWCRVDPNRFTQALANLLSNAAKFSPKGESVVVTLSEAGKQTVKISVADKGPGIPKSFQDKVFHKFAQADGSTTRTKGGTGLGLNITKSIINAFSGDVFYDTKEGQGTTFYFLLPTIQPKSNGERA